MPPFIDATGRGGYDLFPAGTAQDLFTFPQECEPSDSMNLNLQQPLSLLRLNDPADPQKNPHEPVGPVISWGQREEQLQLP